LGWDIKASLLHLGIKAGGGDNPCNRGRMGGLVEEGPEEGKKQSE